jgi:hypothetical protein
VGNSPAPAIDLEQRGLLGSAEMDGRMSWIRAHPFWTLVILVLVIVLLQYVLFIAPGGHGSGGLDVGPIQPDK